jgi:hypothetical protein
MLPDRETMSEAPRPAQRPVEEVATARAFYAGIGQDVRYFSETIATPSSRRGAIPLN